MTDMGEVSRILGMEVMHDFDEGTLAIIQTAYLDNVLERFGMQKRERRAHFRIQARAISRAAGGQAARSGGDETLPVHHREPPLPRTVH